MTMTVLMLASDRNDPLESLIESAMASELRLLDAGLRRTQARLAAFERQNHLTTAEFVDRYARNELQETLETIEWLGEYRMAQSIQQQIEALRAIRVVH
jgi:hypothetical protein